MEPIASVLVSPASDRKTPAPAFGEALRAAAAGAAEGLAAAAGLAAPLAPAGMVLAGAVRGLAQGAAGAARGGSPGGDAFEAARLLQQEAQGFNLRYLALQEEMQRESREFTAVSNVMKVRHDAARAAIHNIQ